MITTAVNNENEGLTERLIKDVHADLRTAIKRGQLWDSVDYFEIAMAMQKRQNAPFPRFDWLSCAPVTSSGNHYVYIGTVLNGRHNLIFIGKVTEGFDRACEVANLCARTLGA